MNTELDQTNHLQKSNKWNFNNNRFSLLMGYATTYNKLGFSLIPVHGINADGTCTCKKADCRNIGKHPYFVKGIFEHGPKSGTKDLNILECVYKSNPSLNIGIVAGKVSNLTVVDCDGEEGLTAAHDLPIESPLFAKTGNGTHYFFKYQANIANSVKKLPGIDIRNDGGYVVVAPSVHRSGRIYEMVDLVHEFDMDVLPELPETVIQLLYKNESEPPIVDSSSYSFSPEIEALFEDTRQPVDIDEVKNALTFIDPDCDYGMWVELGMALCTLGAEGISLWNTWSSKGKKYCGEDEIRKKAASFQPNGGISLATLYYIAKSYGWSRGVDEASNKNGSGNINPKIKIAPPRDNLNGIASPTQNIEISGGYLPYAVEQTEIALSHPEANVYQQGGQLVRIGNDDRGVMKLNAITSNTLPVTAMRYARYYKINSKGEEYNVNCPDNVSKALCDQGTYRHIPSLVSITRHPLINPDGELLIQNGFDKDLKLFADFEPSAFPIIDKIKNGYRFTKQDALNALAYITEYFDEFPFETPYDKSAAIAALLTGVQRPILPMAPGILVDAGASGSGKGAISSIVGIVAEGQDPVTSPWPTKVEEQSKHLYSKLRTNPAIILYDNLPKGTPLESNEVCIILTSERYSARILGKSIDREVSTRSLLLWTGNNIVLTGDIGRRLLNIRLCSDVENPSTRSFKRSDIISDVKNNRGKLVSAVLTIMLAYIHMGKPSQAIRPFGNYGKWSEMVRLPLIWLGLADPVTKTFKTMDYDPERETLEQLLRLLFVIMSDTKWTVKALVNKLNGGTTNESNDLYQFLLDETNDKELSTKKIGNLLTKHRDKIVNGMKIIKAGEKQGTVEWKIVKKGSY